jgi:hypothetical protein
VYIPVGKYSIENVLLVTAVASHNDRCMQQIVAKQGNCDGYRDSICSVKPDGIA